MKDNYLLYLAGVINENKLIQESKEHEFHNYMFFQNLNIMKSCIDDLMQMDLQKVDNLLSDGHDWANDHVAGAKNSLEQVCNWLKNSMKKEEPDLESL